MNDRSSKRAAKHTPSLAWFVLAAVALNACSEGDRSNGVNASGSESIAGAGRSGSVARAGGGGGGGNPGAGGRGGMGSGATGGSRDAGRGGAAGATATGGTAGSARNPVTSGAGGAAATACTEGTLVFQSDFERGDLNGMWVDGQASITQEQKYAGSASVVYRFDGHFGLTDMVPYREFYLEYWQYLDGMPCASDCVNSGKHFFRFAWWPNKNGGIQKQIDTNMLNGEAGVFWFGFGVTSEAGSYNNYNGAIQTRKWQHMRIAYKANAPGQADALFVWTADDASVHRLTGEFFTADDQMDTFMFTNYDTQPGDPAFGPPRVFLDNLIVRTGPGSSNCMR